MVLSYYHLGIDFLLFFLFYSLTYVSIVAHACILYSIPILCLLCFDCCLCTVQRYIRLTLFGMAFDRKNAHLLETTRGNFAGQCVKINPKKVWIVFIKIQLKNYNPKNIPTPPCHIWWTKEAYFNGSVDLNIENVVKIYFFFGYLLAL